MVRQSDQRSRSNVQPSGLYPRSAFLGCPTSQILKRSNQATIIIVPKFYGLSIASSSSSWCTCNYCSAAGWRRRFLYRVASGDPNAAPLFSTIGRSSPFLLGTKHQDRCQGPTPALAPSKAKLDQEADEAAGELEKWHGRHYRQSSLNPRPDRVGTYNREVLSGEDPWKRMQRRPVLHHTGPVNPSAATENTGYALNYVSTGSGLS
jgi:hypothetical protein